MTRSRSTIGRRSKQKGDQYERDLARRWRESGLFPDAKRGLGQARGGAAAPDVEGLPVWCEAKHRRAISVRAAIGQAEKNTDGRPVAVVVRYHGDGEDQSIVCIRLPEWERLMAAVYLNG